MLDLFVRQRLAGGCRDGLGCLRLRLALAQTDEQEAIAALSYSAAAMKANVYLRRGHAFPAGRGCGNKDRDGLALGLEFIRSPPNNAGGDRCQHADRQ